MNQEAIIEALTSHLNSLEATVSALIIITLATAWAGIQRKDPIEIFSTEVRRKDAAAVLSVIYIISNIMIAFLFWRIGDLILLLEKDTYVEGLSVVATHRWILNPYALFEDSVISQIVASVGFGLLIVVWWMGFTSLYALRDNKNGPTRHVFDAVFLIIGLLSMLCVQRVYLIVLYDLNMLPIKMRETLSHAFIYRSVATFCGIVLGSLYFSFVNLIDNQVKRQNSAIDFDSLSKSTALFNKDCDEVEVRGLPFFLSGWNGRFHASTKLLNGRAIWVRPAHIYAFWFPKTIAGSSIWFDGEKWVLQRDMDPDTKVFQQSEHSNQSPVGSWKGSMEVHEVRKA